MPRSATNPRRALPFAASLILLLVASVGVSGSAAAQSSLLVPGNALVAGRGYGQWVAAAFQWRLMQPDITPNKAKCYAAGQRGPVWFLGGSDFKGNRISRACVIPAGRHIMLFVPSVDCSTVESAPFHATTNAGLRRCARAWYQHHQGEEAVTLDGMTLQPPGYVGGTEVFPFKMPAHDNYIRVPGRTHGRAAVYGAATILQPLSPGTHTLVQIEAYAHTSAYTTITYKLTIG